MKVRFRIRTILLFTLAFGIALACLRWVQQERLKHADALQAKFAEMGVHNGFIPNLFYYEPEKKNPTFKEQLFGNIIYPNQNLTRSTLLSQQLEIIGAGAFLRRDNSKILGERNRRKSQS